MVHNEIDVDLVVHLIANQFPSWAHLPISPVKNSGWDNRTFHLGDEMTVRLPSAEHYAGAVEKEQTWLPHLAPQLPLPIPQPLAKGEPDDIYPWPWSIYCWLEGEIAQMHTAMMLLAGHLDTAAAAEIWAMATIDPIKANPVWYHGDVAAGNLLVRGGELSAVIDFGGVGVGDPACDMTIAWTFLESQSRNVFRTAVGANDEIWNRGRGWALWKAMIILANLIETNPIEAASAEYAINQLMQDH